MSLSNLGLSISLQIFSSCSTHPMSGTNIRAPSRLVYGGLHCLVESQDLPDDGSEEDNFRSLVAIPLLKEGNRYFRAAFPPMPIPIQSLWTMDPTLIYAPRFRELGSDVRDSISTSVRIRDKLGSRIVFMITAFQPFWEIGEWSATPFWNRFGDFSCFIGNQENTIRDVEALVFGIKDEECPDSQYYVYLGFTKANGIDEVYCEIEEASLSRGTVARKLGRWLEEISNLMASDLVSCSTAELKVRNMANMPSGMKVISVGFNGYGYCRPAQSRWSQPSDSSSVAAVAAKVKPAEVGRLSFPTGSRRVS